MRINRRGFLGGLGAALAALTVAPKTLLATTRKPLLVVQDGWVLCNGAELSRADYYDLFKTIGNIYGESIPTMHFNIPDWGTKDAKKYYSNVFPSIPVNAWIKALPSPDDNAPIGTIAMRSGVSYE